jgi:hypothetical protein
MATEYLALLSAARTLCDSMGMHGLIQWIDARLERWQHGRSRAPIGPAGVTH